MRKQWQIILCLVLAFSVTGCAGGIEKFGKPKTRISEAEQKRIRDNSPPSGRLDSSDEAGCYHVLANGDNNTAEYVRCSAFSRYSDRFH